MNTVKKIGVIGASIAGPAVCYWLRKYGFEPVLIEKNPVLRTGGYAIDIRGIAVDVAKMMGVYQTIVDQRTTIKTSRYIDSAGNVIHEEPGESYGFREGLDVEIVRSELVDILMQQIPDVPCHFNRYAVKIDQVDDGVVVEFNDGDQEKFDCVIGADGLHSSTRRHVFTTDEFTTFDLGSYISIFTIPNYLQLKHECLLLEADEKNIEVHSDHNSAEALVGFMFRSRTQLENIQDPQQQKAFLQRTFANFGWETSRLFELLEHSDDLYFDSITQVKMPSWTKQRVALLGDAGYCASPLSGQGTSLALVGAYILAGELKVAQGDYQQAFQRYNEKLRPFVEPNQALGAWVSEFFLVKDKQSVENVERRSQEIMQRMNIAANAIPLPLY
jgi:2-polyprenyl-6-methoxyphenol hydroxylase-like FAD-dependent oxidoreductase